MPRKSYTIEQIISMLQEAEMLLGQGQTVGISADHSISVNKPFTVGGRNMAGSAQIKCADRRIVICVRCCLMVLAPP